jgi:OOP family OmpA-OmpF porin
MNQRKLALGLAAGLVAIPMGAAMAQTSGSTVDRWLPRQDRAFEPGFYVGGGIGYYRVEEQDFFGPDDDLDDEQVSFKVYGGGDFLSWLSAEIGYVNFGEVGDGTSTLEADGFTVAGLASVPVGNFAPYAKVGYLWWDADAGTGGSDDGNDWFGGLGVRFALTDMVDMRAEYERYQFDTTGGDVDTDMLSLNLQYMF